MQQGVRSAAAGAGKRRADGACDEEERAPGWWAADSLCGRRAHLPGVGAASCCGWLAGWLPEGAAAAGGRAACLRLVVLVTYFCFLDRGHDRPPGPCCPCPRRRRCCCSMVAPLPAAAARAPPTTSTNPNSDPEPHDPELVSRLLPAPYGSIRSTTAARARVVCQQIPCRHQDLLRQVRLLQMYPLQM